MLVSVYQALYFHAVHAKPFVSTNLVETLVYIFLGPEMGYMFPYHGSAEDSTAQATTVVNHFCDVALGREIAGVEDEKKAHLEGAVNRLKHLLNSNASLQLEEGFLR
jgi:hypothetical protein